MSLLVSRSLIFLLWPVFALVSALAQAAAFELKSAYTGEVWQVASERESDGPSYLDNLDVVLDIDGEEAFAARGLRFHGYSLYNNGHSLNGDLVRSAQGVSNIEANPAWRLYELWAEWQSEHLPLSILFGLYDLNSEFDAIESAGLFINPSHGIGVDFSQSGQNGPSIFPVTSLALRARAELGAWRLQGAVLDAVPGDPDHPRRTAIELDSEEGALVVAELGYTSDSMTRIAVGHWRYTAKFEHLSATDANSVPVRLSGNVGTYVFAETPLLLNTNEQDSMHLFARLGIANDRFNAIERYAGAGIHYKGLWSSRNDSLGLAVAIATLGKHSRDTRIRDGESVASHEYNMELTYRIALDEALALQVDVQHIRYPNMDAAVDSVWAFGLRIELQHDWDW